MENKDQENKLLLRLSSFLKLVSLLVPGLYLIGYFYDYGYLSAFNISVDYFPRSKMAYLIDAFMLFLTFVSGLLKNTDKLVSSLIVGASLIYLISLLSVFAAKREKYIKRKTDDIKKWKFYDYIIYPLFASFLGLAIPYLLILLLGFCALIPLASYSAGKREGQRNISDFKGCKTLEQSNDDSCTFILDANNNLIQKGMFITRSDKKIALYDGQRSIIIPEKEDTIILTRKNAEGSKTTK